MADATRRPDAPLVHHDGAEHRRQIAMRANASLPYDGSRGMGNPLLLAPYAIADLPTASLWENGLVYVTNDIGGAVPAFSDGTDWRRCTDRAVVSVI